MAVTIVLAIDGGPPVRKEFLVFGKPVLGEEEIAEVVSSIRSGWIGTGPKVHTFEKAFGDYIGAKHAVAVNSCTAALHLSLLAAGVGQGHEVITTPITFGSTANSIVHTGAVPVFVDVGSVGPEHQRRPNRSSGDGQNPRFAAGALCRVPGTYGRDNEPG